MNEMNEWDEWDEWMNEMNKWKPEKWLFGKWKKVSINTRTNAPLLTTWNQSERMGGEAITICTSPNLRDMEVNSLCIDLMPSLQRDLTFIFRRFGDTVIASPPIRSLWFQVVNSGAFVRVFILTFFHFPNDHFPGHDVYDWTESIAFIDVV